jgi:hypothetical protein
MADKCPICYRNLGTWKKDPILLSNGAPYDWISDTELVYEPDVNNRWYRGVYQISEPEVQELQDALKILEIQNLDVGDRTTFSPLNASGKFQITGKHIKEMRDSVEKLIEAMGITKTEYFNYDEEFNHIIHPNGDKVEWTDPITSSTDLTKFQVKGIHIEDLRHYFNILWEETWDTTFTWSKSIYKEAPGAIYVNHGWGLVEWYYSQLITEDKNWQTKLSHQRAQTGTYPEAFGDSHLDANLTDYWSLSGVSNCDGHYAQITWTASSWNDYRLELLDSIGLKIWQGDPIPVTDLHFIIEGLSISGSASK